MKLYMAPLEGITGYVFRSTYQSCFGNIDKYFVPFIKPNQNGHLSSRERQDILPENNKGMYTVPQILTNSPEDFLRTVKKLQQYGYKEVNLNLGCPSRTVVTKGRGAGFLAEPEKLESFLDYIFDKTDVEISIKTRLGMEKAEEFERILAIYNRYPLKELIIHPRVQKDFYKNHPNREAYRDASGQSKNPVCYNGDIFSIQDYRTFMEQFPETKMIMLGRGLLMNPGLAGEIRCQEPMDKKTLREFHDRLYAGYCEALSGEKTILFKMKELWSYLAPAFSDYQKYAKRIKKAERLIRYEEAVDELFAEQDV
jgi:tRNA-dihydrouridine synthase